jgi:cyclopropane-fatty-acyl-phospholipid synthase
MSLIENYIRKKLAEADIELNGSRDCDITIHDPRCLRRIVTHGSMALGETYVEKMWDAPRVDQLIDKIHRASHGDIQTSLPALASKFYSKFVNQQTRSRSRKVGEQHYDIGNRFYEKMLDKRMLYTCAYWQDADNLEQAQKNKLDLIARKLQFQPGMKILDLGCGWGGAAQYFAENYGVEATGVTISKEQASWGQEHSKGLAVNILHGDYRDFHNCGQKFDRVVSIGLMEHVGHKNYPLLFEIVKQSLHPDGLALIHTIGRKTEDKVTDPWFTTYIFPHGYLPSLAQLARAVNDNMVIEDLHNIGDHYDRTLLAWYDNFVTSWDQFKNTYPPHFFRMWEYYLLASAGSFRARHQQLWQIVLSPSGVKGGYQGIR